MGIPMQITDGESIAILDKHTSSLVTLTHEEHEIHSGLEYRVTAQESVGSGNFHNVTFKTPSTNIWVHFNAESITQNEAVVSFYELANPPTVNGSAITPRNSNRNFPDSSQIQFMFEDSTLNLTGNILLAHAHIGAVGNNPSQTSIGGASPDTVSEWVLKPDTWYSMHLVDEAASAQEMSILCQWHEIAV